MQTLCHFLEGTRASSNVDIYKGQGTNPLWLLRTTVPVRVFLTCMTFGVLVRQNRPSCCRPEGNDLCLKERLSGTVIVDREWAGSSLALWACNSRRIWELVSNLHYFLLISTNSFFLYKKMSSGSNWLVLKPRRK